MKRGLQMPIRSKQRIIEYSISTTRPYAGTFGGDVYDVLPCRVELSVQFLSGKDALEWERRVRDELEAMASGSEA